MNFEHRVRCLILRMCQRKDQVRRLGHVKSLWAPWGALRTLSACLAVSPTCHRGASWVSVGDTARHQHLSLKILGRPWPQAGHLLIPLPLQICPRTFPCAHFSLFSCWKLWKRELKIAKMERAIWRQFLEISSLGVRNADIDTASLLFGDSSELPFLIVIIFFF